VTSWSLGTAAPTCAITDAPTGLVDDAATFHARLDAGPASGTTAAFELGATAAYGARSPAITLLANSGLQDITLSTPGLTPGATYHVRAIALRNGTIVATGADRTFVAGADTPPPVERNGDGVGGSGSGGSGGSGGGGSSPQAPQLPGSEQPLPVLTVPKATMKGLARSVRLDSKGRLVLSFRATPAKTRGSLKILYGKLSAAAGSFTVPAGGRVKLTLKTSAQLRAALRKKPAGVKVKATMKLGITSFSAGLTIKPYKKPAKRK
jgi:hypothetical protein